jgi:hypothetical protein
VVGFHSVVGVLGGVVLCSRQEIHDHANQGVGPIGGDLSRHTVRTDRIGEELRGCLESRFLDTNTSMTCPYWSTAR